MVRGVGGDGEPSDGDNTYHSLSEALHFHAGIQYLMYFGSVFVASAARRCTLARATWKAATEKGRSRKPRGEEGRVILISLAREDHEYLE